MSLLQLYECTHAEVMASRLARVGSGPLRNGEPSAHAFGPVEQTVVSPSAMWSTSLTGPTDGVRPVSISIPVKCIAGIRHR